MPPIRTIITHPGSAHKDEFLACCVLLARQPVVIVRREVFEADLADATLCVVDVGHRHEPELNNFDHHQFSREQTPTCSLSLVLKHLGLYEDAREFCDWLETAEWFDCRGPVATAQWLGTSRECLNKLSSPIDISLIRAFSQTQCVEPGQPLWEIMRVIGADMLNYIQGLHDRLAFIKTHAQLWSFGEPGRPADVLFLPRTDPLPEDPSSGLERYVDHVGLADRVVGVIYPDSRGPGYGMSRFRDHPYFDFLRVMKDPRVHFAHARGFMAKTTSTDLENLRALLQAAVVK